MASVRKNARGIWLARWVDASGVRRSRAAVPNTRAAAKGLAEELQLNARRQQEGLAPRLPRDGGGTVASLLEWWLESYSRRLASHTSNEGSVRRHLVPSALAELYDRLPTVDFSHAVVQQVPCTLRVIPAQPCGWTDLGTPRRVADTLRRLLPGQVPTPTPDGCNVRAWSTPGLINLAAQQARLAVAD